MPTYGRWLVYFTSQPFYYFSDIKIYYEKIEMICCTHQKMVVAALGWW